MSRHFFSGAPCFAFAYDGTNVIMIAGATITAWDSQSSGTRITNLLAADGSTAIDHIESADGTGAPLGQCPPFYGPDGVSSVWLSANGGPRVLACASDLDVDVVANKTSLGSVSGALQAFDASLAVPNGIGTLGSDGLLVAEQRPVYPADIDDNTDVTLSSLSANNYLMYSLGAWRNFTKPSWLSMTWASGFQSHAHQLIGSPATSEANASSPRVLLDTKSGIVFLRGAVERTAGGAIVPSGNDQLVATLPAFLPSVKQSFSVGSQLNSGNQQSVRLEIGTDGSLTVWNSASYRPTWVSIDCAYIL